MCALPPRPLPQVCASAEGGRSCNAAGDSSRHTDATPDAPSAGRSTAGKALAAAVAADSASKMRCSAVATSSALGRGCTCTQAVHRHGAQWFKLAMPIKQAAGKSAVLCTAAARRKLSTRTLLTTTHDASVSDHTHTEAVPL